MINTTEWKYLDVLFITPHLLEYVLSQKEIYDPHDINPEIVYFDDFDLMLDNPKFEFIQKHLKKLFNKNFSKFNRKLVLSSSTINTAKQFYEVNYKESLLDNLSIYKKYLNDSGMETKNKLEVLSTENFMNISYYLKNVKIHFKYHEDDDKILEHKFKSLMTMLTLLHTLKHSNNIVLCSQESSIYLKDHLKKKKIDFISIDESI
jgi:hypothetical protein